jgi:hypothetical protein
MERIIERRGWDVVMNDFSSMLFGIQDASLMAENMVIAAESLGLGSCFLGLVPYRADRIAQEYGLPERVFPLVQLVMGYPAEAPPVRPRFPLAFTLFENEYPVLSEEQITQAMQAMDEGYLDQDYYRATGAMIPLKGDREETFTLADYSWTEHMCRKSGQWFPSPHSLLDQFEKRGFRLGSPAPADVLVTENGVSVFTDPQNERSA